MTENASVDGLCRGSLATRKAQWSLDDFFLQLLRYSGGKHLQSLM